MARGDVHVFAAWELAVKNGAVQHDIDTDVLKMGIVTSATVPTVGTADPRWGAGGTTNFATNEVATGSSYSAGGPTLASVTYTRATGVDTFTAANIVVATDATGFTNGAYGIIYDSTDAGKRAIAFVDLGGPVSIQGGALNINWNASGIFAETCS